VIDAGCYVILSIRKGKKVIKAIIEVIILTYSLTSHYLIYQSYTFFGQDKQGEKHQQIDKDKESKDEEQLEAKPRIPSAAVISGKALKKVLPKYPKKAKKAGIGGEVGVKIVVDEKGKVIKADAVSGDALLHEAAERAALKWRFEPTLLYGKPVKVSGFIKFNFVS
jgi:TonB family protein